MKYLVPFLLLTLLTACGKKGEEIHAERRDLTETVFASGMLEPEELYNLTAQTDGYITVLGFKEGDLIERGDTLVVIDNAASAISALSADVLLGIAARNASDNGPAIQQAELNMQLAQKKMQQDSLQATRYEKLLALNAVSKLEAENAKLAYQTSTTNFKNAIQTLQLTKQQADQQLINQKAQRDINSVSSSFNVLKGTRAGKIYKRLKQQGDYVRRGEVIAIIGNATQLYARLNVDEDNIAKVKVGQMVSIQLNTLQDSLLMGTISLIYPAFEESSQAYVCRATVQIPEPMRLYGTQLQANIVIAQRKNVLVIPRKTLDFGNTVNIKDKGPTTIQTGFISTEWAEVTGGLTEADILIAPRK